jgi:putative ABC transport system permease protein
MGAPQNSIMVQFLTEAIVICLLGGIVGVFLGLTLGNILSASLKGDFVVPWMWLGIGLLSCVVVGVLSGIYPANKAAKMDPIESLRHE